MSNPLFSALSRRKQRVIKSDAASSINRKRVQCGTTAHIIFMRCPGLLGEWRSASSATADQFFSNLRMFGTSLGCCMIPASCKSLAESCLAGSCIIRVTFASVSTLKCIGEGAFRGCKELREIEIPASLEEIGGGCFYECSSLSRVTFASGSALRRIGAQAFYSCEKLSEIEIPACVELAGDPGVSIRRR